jgi:hypothetical protein
MDVQILISSHAQLCFFFALHPKPLVSDILNTSALSVSLNLLTNRRLSFPFPTRVIQSRGPFLATDLDSNILTTVSSICPNYPRRRQV